MTNLQKTITKKNIMIFFLNFHKSIYSLSSISLASLKLLTVMVFEISSFLCPNLQRAITKKNNDFF